MSRKRFHSRRPGDLRETRQSKSKKVRRKDMAERFMREFLEAMAHCEKEFRIAFHSRKGNGGRAHGAEPFVGDDLLSPEKRFVLEFVSEFADMNRALHRVGGWR
jgi:hypothetical protein